MQLYRSILFVPGNRAEWIDKAPQYGADALILDLEAAVVAGVVAIAIAIAIPKLERREEVLKVDAWIEWFERKAGLPERSVEIIVLPETARGIMNTYELATACPRVGNIAGGIAARSGDITTAVGYQWTRGSFEPLYMASHMLLAARAAGIEYPLNAGSLEVRDIDLVRAQLQRAREVGFRGALAIHPTAVPIANAIFAPSLDEIAWNKGVLCAMAAAEQAGRAAVTYDGMMIDYAHVRNALDLLHQADGFGIAVGNYPEVKAL